jgi:hypothetical protein
MWLGESATLLAESAAHADPSHLQGIGVPIMRWLGVLLLSFAPASLPSNVAAAPDNIAAQPGADSPAFAYRGYYFTLCRMPTYGLDAWKQIIECVAADKGNVVILWMGGGFRSRKFPETWAYNQEHANVRQDFVRDLIEYAHAKNIKVLLGFTPFGYDGVNQMSLSRPEWKATGSDGNPTKKFGWHSWGFNLCPAREDTQRFMFDYAHELVHDFYPNADGLLVESSDYAACHCRNCGSKFYENEFRFVKAISEDVWKTNKDALIFVYPHYFTGARVPELGVTAAKQSFDPRWALFFTPHSAPPDAKLIAQARESFWSDAAPARNSPADIREGARRARREKCSGYVPSLEVFTYVPTEAEEGQPYLVGQRRVPLGMGWLKEGQMPYGELPIRINRIAFRLYTQNPDLTDAEFQSQLGRELFGDLASPEAVADALRLQQVFAADRTWSQPAPLLSPERVAAMKAAGQLTDAKRAEYRAALDRVRAIDERYREKGPVCADLHRTARWITDLWRNENTRLLAP